MADYTLVMRVRLEAIDDLQARRKARELLQEMRQHQVSPQAQLVLRRQGPDANRNLLTNDK